ncbi:NAD(P)/FAD-dependent oxidoreductase [Nocardia blacklockiae]|uniref:NAD(P)/FAD-dependent oxidoreductase n=1 Tax=Nocardia blacklockiae TaxID=480036 RepID=UPI0018945A60|nr:FAD-dependent monooxygenase [Nocardia blacklockiae]MBF6173679.1 FAD-dependent monooxygenase [Nocardia blacklockiae]
MGVEAVAAPWPSGVAAAGTDEEDAVGRTGERRAGGHAVVLGCGMAGLFAARVLADHFANVTVLERDRLGEGAKRRGVPQGEHSHGLLMRAAEIAEARFPGLIDELIADGAKPFGAFEDFRAVFFGNVLNRAATGRSSLAASRPFLESHVRARVAALPNVTLCEDVVVAGLVASGSGVGGVWVIRRETEGESESIAADLVVDAMGRGSRVGAWLAELGYPRPREDRVPVDIGYATCHFHLPLDAVGGDRVVLVGPTPNRPRGFGFAAQEGPTWVLSAFGVGKHDRPPADPEALREFAADFAPRDVGPVIRRATPVDTVATYRFKTAVWRRYELLQRFPDGILSIGDAVCCFNPVYGSGMTVAAVTAELLDEVLSEGTEELPRRYYRRVGRMLRTPWWVTKVSDMTLPPVPVGPPWVKSLLYSGADRVFRAAANDRVAAAAFLDVLNMDKSPLHMLKPRVAAATVGLVGRRR